MDGASTSPFDAITNGQDWRWTATKRYKPARCTEERVSLQANKRELQLFPADKPLDDVAMDLLGELPWTKREYTTFLVIVDRFSKLVRTVPLKRTDSWSLEKVFTTHWVFLFGPPQTILTDNGGNFTSRFMLATHRILGIKAKMTTAYHPQTNGQTERFNRTITAALRKFRADNPTDWDLLADALMFGYNSHVHTPTGMVPFDLVLSRTSPNMGAEHENAQVGRKAKEARFEWLNRLRGSVEFTKEQLH